ncbi:hypothetical protein B0H66DRAFT_24479 [Apodospora peruviana]|uniref:Uncharacterized protein n=1 Tax=Apodospora peruviana TaxID=516989 RepID=A0AAE0IQS6_9PEZI|nr:hypothetical protein B0H66DRAFT_24479 [Apodospora peruviana]
MVPPTLDLSRTAHSKMIISPPRINLRRATSYSYDKGPLSSTSSRFTFNHLVFSPPPSPGLPSLSPPPRKPPKGITGIIRPRRVLRLLLWILTVFCIFHGLRWAIDNSPLPLAIHWVTGRYDQSDTATQENLPDFPTPIIITDKRGRPSWTFSIPPSRAFPLTIGEYVNVCEKCREMSEQVQEQRSRNHGLQTPYLGFGSDTIDHGFLDVQEAQKAGYLVSSTVGKGGGSSKDLQVCERSLTVVLESADAGMGRALMALWTAYGVAQKEGRAFFIDDTRWAYGKYSDIFQPPASPNCAPPPSHEMLPCPRQARHLVVTAATASEIFLGLVPTTSGRSNGAGPAEPPLAPSARKTVFALARQGHDALFRLNREDSNYVDNRARELTAKRIIPKTKGKQNGLAVGVHVRRGDRHPFEYQYRDSYMPLNTYTDAVWELIEDRFSHSGPLGGGAEDVAAKEHSFIVLASDDPMIYESNEVMGVLPTFPAQDRIRLASKQAIQDANGPPDKHVMRKFVDETFGWEGGFFAAMFWNLGMGGAASRTNANTNAANMAKAAELSRLSTATTPSQPSAETIRLRSLVGRAYMMDLAVVAEVSDVVVCTVSALGCRLLAVMMGWENAMEKGGWVNVDGGYDWLGVE